MIMQTITRPTTKKQTFFICKKNITRELMKEQLYAQKLNSNHCNRFFHLATEKDK